MRFKELDISTQIILKVIIAGLALVFLWMIRDVILILLLALVAASAMEPMADYFNKHKIPRAVSVLTVYVLVFSLIAAIIYLMVPLVGEQFKNLRDNLPGYINKLQEMFGAGTAFNLSLNDVLDRLASAFQGGELVSRTFGVFSGFFTFITVLVVSFYLVAEEKGMKRFVADLVPEKQQEFTLSLIAKVQKKIGMWVLGQVILSISIFILALAGLLILGIPNSLILALLAGALEIIPYIGPFISAVPAVLIAFVYNPPLALAVALMYLIIQKIEGYVLVPKIMEKTVGVSPLVIVVAVLVGFKLAGVAGLLLAVPIASAVLVLVRELGANKS